ncbi:unnamed protein product, partial [Cyprideis torosa]
MDLRKSAPGAAVSPEAQPLKRKTTSRKSAPAPAQTEAALLPEEKGAASKPPQVKRAVGSGEQSNAKPASTKATKGLSDAGVNTDPEDWYTLSEEKPASVLTLVNAEDIPPLPKLSLEDTNRAKEISKSRASERNCQRNAKENSHNLDVESCGVKGVVIWYHVKRGFGFIKQDNEQGELFVHRSNILRNNPKKAIPSLAE